MGRKCWSIESWEFDGPYDEPPVRVYHKGDEWDDELQKEFDLREESEIEEVDE